MVAAIASALRLGKVARYGGAEWALDRRGNVHLHSIGDATEAYAMRDAVQRLVQIDLNRTDERKDVAW